MLEKKLLQGFYIALITIMLLPLATAPHISKASYAKIGGPYGRCHSFACLSYAFRRTYLVQAPTPAYPVTIYMYISGIAENANGGTGGLAKPGFSVTLLAPSNDIVLNVLSDSKKFYGHSTIIDEYAAIIRSLIQLICSMSPYPVPCPTDLIGYKVPEYYNVDVDSGQMFAAANAGCSCWFWCAGCSSDYFGGMAIAVTAELIYGAPEDNYYGWYSYVLDMHVVDSCCYTWNMAVDITPIDEGTCVYREDQTIECFLNGGPPPSPPCPSCPLPYGDSDTGART